MKIYVDVDGTLLDSSLDKEFERRVKLHGADRAKAWYDSCHVADLKVNWVLASVLKRLKSEGHELVLWTNRGESQIDMTKKNLGCIWSWFSSHEFHAGQKNRTSVSGMVIDNEVKHIINGTDDMLVSF